MDHFRRSLLLSGLAGLLACGLAAFISAWLVIHQVIKAPLPHPALIWLLVLIFGGFSIAEIPMMVFTMRRLVAERPNNRTFVLGLNTVYVFFAAVYGVPVLLLTGNLVWGLVLCALGLVRLAVSSLLVHRP